MIERILVGFICRAVCASCFRVGTRKILLGFGIVVYACEGGLAKKDLCLSWYRCCGKELGGWRCGCGYLDGV